ncbi:hypothetical protein C8Q74DRAFT_1204035 [Fomes fomentarius]|nr:hypothetical protein C8Q74DRAFT_1204035 [Fomes fomentarius]
MRFLLQTPHADDRARLITIVSVAVEAFIQDVQQFVTDEFHKATADITADEALATPHYRTRLAELQAWRAQEHPLSYGDPHASNLSRLSLIIHPTRQAAVSFGLPHSHIERCSPAQFAKRIYTMAISENARSRRAPFCKDGAFWPVIRTAVAESFIILPTASEKDRATEFQAAIVSAVKQYAINFFPDASTPGAHNPSFTTWTRLDLPNHAPHLLSTAQPTLEQRQANQMTQNAQQVMEHDPHAPWCTSDVTLSRYHLFMNREVLPDDFSVRPAHPEATGGLTLQSYQWAETWLHNHITDWRSRLAQHLAFLHSRISPNIGYAQEDVPVVSQSILPSSTPQERVDQVRKLGWAIKVQSGVSPSHYFSQALVFYLCWIHDGSPLRKALGTSDPGLSAWLSKHTQKSLGIVNLIRFGIAYPLNNRIWKAGRYGHCYTVRPQEELQTWLGTVARLLGSKDSRPRYQLCETIFGPQGVALLVEARQLEPKPSRASNARPSASHAPGPSRAHSCQDDDQPARPSKRLRTQ